MEYTIENQALALTSSTLGAGLRSLSTRQGLPLLGEGATVCFPWCGTIEGGWYEDRGFQYREADSLNGFVRDKEHLLMGREPGQLSFRLEWPGSLGLWPWAFEVETVHTLEGNRVVTVCTVENRSGRPMPVQFGFHTELCCPFLPETEVREYQVRLESGRVIPLKPELFGREAPDVPEAEAWVRLEHRETGKYLEVGTQGYPGVHLAGGAGVLCLELWSGAAGRGHELMDRPGTELMPHGEKRSWRQVVAAEL